MTAECSWTGDSPPPNLHFQWPHVLEHSSVTGRVSHLLCSVQSPLSW